MINPYLNIDVKLEWGAPDSILQFEGLFNLVPPEIPMGKLVQSILVVSMVRAYKILFESVYGAFDLVEVPEDKDIRFIVELPDKVVEKAEEWIKIEIIKSSLDWYEAEDAAQVEQENIVQEMNDLRQTYMNRTVKIMADLEKWYMSRFDGISEAMLSTITLREAANFLFYFFNKGDDSGFHVWNSINCGPIPGGDIYKYFKIVWLLMSEYIDDFEAELFKAKTS